MTAEGGFNPTWQRHVAAYALCEPFLPDGAVVDVGCGVGHSYRLLAPRETVGVDLDGSVLPDQQRRTVVADMRRMPFATGEFPAAVAVHSIEHVPDTERALAELARVTAAEGVAVLVTPNRLTFARSDEIIDPYHYVELDPGQLAAACAACFEEVELAGIFGSERYLAIVRRERAKLDRLLRRDPLRLRRLLPRRLRQLLYDWRLRRERPAPDGEAQAIAVDDFHLARDGLETALDLVAICRRPRHGPPRRPL